jgi:crotonobetainyl-CoA:carnitine CoA-transferase CaiB-like acyl-CoA transferase
VACAACVSMDDHFVDPQVIHNDLYRTATWEGIGTARYVRYPAIFGHWGHLVAETQPPHLGQDAMSFASLVSRTPQAEG